MAPEIAAAVSKRDKMLVRRTSLKYRNPGNEPDAWERTILEQFEARKTAGEDASALEHDEVVESDVGTRFRYLKAIPTADVCLACHGTELQPEVEAKLDDLYPQDRARVFRIGDLRGAFSITQPLD